MSSAHPSTCPACGQAQARSLVQVERVPVLCNHMCGSRQEALNVDMGSIDLVFCELCEHVFNAAFEPERVQYSPEYENSLHFSGVFAGYCDELAEALWERYPLAGGTVVEIGSGSGDFLKAVCRGRRCHGRGFDPSYPGESGAEDPETGVRIERSMYGPDHAGQKVDLLCSRHVLEHVAGPAAFVRGLRAVAGNAPVFCEVPNGLWTLRDGGIWDIIYEHCGYFTPSSLSRVYQVAGYEVTDVATGFGGQFLQLHARVPAVPSSAADAFTPADTSDFNKDVEAFAGAYRSKLQAWREQLAAAGERGHRVLAWGAGSKGSTFLNVVDTTGVVSHVVDVNPRKAGKFMAGTGQPIVDPAFVREHAPDLVVVMNAIYRDEIRATLKSMGVQPDLAVA